MTVLFEYSGSLACTTPYKHLRPDFELLGRVLNEPVHVKHNKITVAPSDDSDQHGTFMVSNQNLDCLHKETQSLSYRLNIHSYFDAKAYLSLS